MTSHSISFLVIPNVIVPPLIYGHTEIMCPTAYSISPHGCHVIISDFTCSKQVTDFYPYSQRVVLQPFTFQQMMLSSAEVLRPES